MSGSLSTTPTPVSSEDAGSTAADTVKLLQSASAAAAAAANDRNAQDTAGDEDDNVVTTIDEVSLDSTYVHTCTYMYIHVYTCTLNGFSLELHK